jgi:hypothetical protein
MKVQLLTAAIVLLGVISASAEDRGDKEDNTGYLTGPNSVLKSDITLQSSAGLQSTASGANNEQARGVCDPATQYRVGDHCNVLGPD